MNEYIAVRLRGTLQLQRRMALRWGEVWFLGLGG